jgi:hypothetical protein
LYKAWVVFYQRGHNLNERAKGTKKLRAYREVWNSVSESGTTYGIDFGISAEDVLKIISEQRTEILETATRSQTQTG